MQINLDWDKLVDGDEMNPLKRIPLGLVIVSVAMLFAAFGTDVFWLAKLVGKPFAQTLPVDSKVYNAFVLPDIILSLLLYIGAFGLLRLKRYGFVISLVAMGMWLSDTLLVLAITKADRVDFIIPSLVFAAGTIFYLWVKRELFG